MIRIGRHYKERYNLDKPNMYGEGCEKTETKKTKTGYSHLRMTNFISIYKTKITVNKDGTTKALTKVKCNYQFPYQYTVYFDRNGLEIVGENKAEELKYYKNERKIMKETK